MTARMIPCSGLIFTSPPLDTVSCLCPWEPLGPEWAAHLCVTYSASGRDGLCHEDGDTLSVGWPGDMVEAP